MTGPVIVDVAEAERRAAAKLQEMSNGFGAELAWWIEEPGQENFSETDREFIFYWNTAEYMRTRDDMALILGGPIVVPKDGAPVWIMETAYREEEALRRYWERRASR